MRIASTLFLLVALTACGKDKDKGSGGGGGGGGGAGSAKVEGGGGMGKREKKPIPADKLIGTVRLINLGVAADGKTQRVDVWAAGGWPAATKLASGIDFGKASDWFKTPIGVGMHLIIVPEGAAGEDANKLAGMNIGWKDRHETTVFNRGEDGKLTSYTNGGADELPKPAAGKSLVMIHAGQLTAFEKDLAASPLGGRSFMLGEPGGTCNAAVLGGTNYTKSEVAPGKVKFTLHKFPGDCKSPALSTIEADVAADKGVRVEVFTKDGKSLETTAMPLHFKE